MTRDAIAELAHAYSDAVIQRDGRRWAGCWAPDATWSLPGDRHSVGLEAIIATWESSMARYRMVVQHTLDGAVTLDGDRGRGRWHISEHTWRLDGTPGILLAHYDDEYVRLAGGWRFASRALTVQYKGPPDLSAALASAQPDPSKEA